MPDTIDPGRPHAYVPGAAGGRCLTCYRPAVHRIHSQMSEPQPMTDLVWSKQDTHCLWCGKPRATEVEWDLNHDDAKHDEDSCWCMEWCWGNCDEYITDRAVSGLRAEIEVLRGIVQRVKDGWWPGDGWPGEDPDTAGLWEHADVAFDETPDPERMTEAEQIAWYGRVVREEEKS